MPDGRVVARKTLQQHVRNAVKPYWRNSKGNYAGFFDTKFYLPSRTEIDAALARIDFPSYAQDEFDCEDFAYLCKAETARRVRISDLFNDPWALGMAWAHFQWINGGQIDHACNWVVMNSGHFAWIEPQTKTLYPVEACTGDLVLFLA